MQRPPLQGSAFRNKMPKEPTVKDVETAMLNSGLLGKMPSQYRIKYSKPSLADQKPPPEIFLPPISSSRTGQNTYRTPSGTPRSRAAPPTSARRRPQTATATKKIPKENSGILTTRTLDKTTNVVEPPNIFYGKILRSNDPPSSVNFIQLNEILDRLLRQQNDDYNLFKEEEEEEKENDNNENDKEKEEMINISKENKGNKIDEKRIYYNIFSEIIRQYFVECSDQGDVLCGCRDFFSKANSHIPNIRKHYEDIIADLIKRTFDHRNAMKTIGPEIEKNNKHRAHLTKIIQEFRKDLGTLQEHHDVLMAHISAAFKELMDMKENIKQVNSRLESKNRKLIELIEEMRQLELISASYTSDTIRFAENLRSIRLQQESGRKHISIGQEEINRLKKAISRIDKDIINFTTDIETSRMKPVVANFGIQVDLVSRRLFKEPKNLEVLMKNNINSEEFSGNLFQKIKDEYIKMAGFATMSIINNKNDEIVINSFEDMAKFKKVLLKHENEFHIDSAVIEAAQNGEFVISPENNDFITLFASVLSKSIVMDAIEKVAIHQISTQTLAKQQKFEPEVTDLEKMKGTSRFLKMIESDYSQRSPQRLDWLLKTIRELYDSKAIVDDDVLNQKLSTDLMSFPEYIYNYAYRKFDLQFLSDQYCWDIYITSHEHKGRSQEIDLFIAFLDEVFNAEQLSFFLIGRSDCLKVGSSVTIFTRDNLEKYNEYFLSSDQIENLLKLWWFNRFKKEFFNSIMDLSTTRPAIHLEATKRYCAMHDILLKNLLFFSEDAVERLHDLLLQYRITPRLTQVQFNKLMKLLIPSLRQDQLAEFHRATVTKSKQRTNSSLDHFVDEFNKSSILINRYTKVTESGNNEEMHRIVVEQWENNKANLMKLFDYMQSQSSLQPDNLTLKMYFDDTSRFLSNLTHSIAIGDGYLSTVHYYQLIFSIDVLFSTLHVSDIAPDTLISLECAIRENWLDKVFYNDD